MHSIFSDYVSKTIKFKSVQSLFQFLRALASLPSLGNPAMPENSFKFFMLTKQ